MLASGGKFGAEYGRQLSNHLPMTLLAMQAQGASPKQLEGFYQRYSRRLRSKRPATTRLDASNWQSLLGKHAHNAEYLQFFAEQIRARGWLETLRVYLPGLLPGIGGAAFHPLIRLAYAVEAEHEAEIAEGLASWAMASLPLRPLDSGLQRFESPRQALQELSNTTALARLTGAAGNPLARLVAQLRFGAATIFTRMQRVAQHAAFAPFADCVEIDADSLAAWARLLVELYASSDDHFTLLHGVTSCHALRILLPHLPEPERALRYYGQAVIAAYVSAGQPRLAVPEVGSLPSWEAIQQAALTSMDDHVIKLAYSCWREDLHYGQALYRFCAARKVGLPLVGQP